MNDYENNWSSGIYYGICWYCRGVMVAPAYLKSLISNSPNERVNIALVGISGNRPRVRGIGYLLNKAGTSNVSGKLNY
jgi:hypothetical protein